MRFIDNSLDENSIANYFRLVNVECVEHSSTSFTQTWLQAPVPQLDSDDIEKEDVFEWLGDVACEAAL